MLISCPDCSAVYQLSSDVLPRESLGDKPQKMRCCKCKTIFLVSLKPTESEAEPTVESEAERTVESEAEPTVESEAEPTAESEAEPTVESEAEPGAEPATEPRAAPGAESKDESEAEVAPGYEEFAVPFENDDSAEGDLTQVELPRQRDESLSHNSESERLCVEVFDYREKSDGLGGEDQGPQPLPRLVDNTGEWTAENVLSLTNFEVRPEVIKAQRKKAMGIVGAGASFLLAFLVILATYHSRWAKSGDELSDEVPVSDETVKTKAPSKTPAKPGGPLGVLVEKQHSLEAVGKNRILVVAGRVANVTDKKLARVLLEGRLLDKEGRTIKKTRAPCGIVYKDTRLQKQKKGTFGSLFKRRGRFLNCGLRPGQNKKFKLVFDDIPQDFNETNHRVEVAARSGG